MAVVRLVKGIRLRSGDLDAKGKYRCPPEFRVGDKVEVILNERNTTPHKGIVNDVIWHFKYEQWFYMISENGKKVSKRYFATDLRKIV